MGKWAKIMGSAGALALLGAAGIFIHAQITAPRSVDSSLLHQKKTSAPRFKHPHREPIPSSHESSTPGASPSSPTVSVSTTESPPPPQKLQAFAGSVVKQPSPEALSSGLPRDYPLKASPVTFYTPGNFMGVQDFSGIVDNHTVQIELFSETDAPGILLAVTANSIPVVTHLFSAPVTIVAFTDDDMIVEARDKKPSWYVVNLVTGKSNSPSGVPPEGIEVHNINIQGIPTVIARDTVEPDASDAKSSPPSSTNRLVDTLVGEANAMLLTTTAPSDVVVSQSSPTEARLVALLPTRWNTIRFSYRNDTWVPTSITTTVDNIALSYVVTGTSSVLTYQELLSLPQQLAKSGFTPLDNQTGALARLPIDLENATIDGGQKGEGAPKVVLSVAGHALLALTYSYQSAHHTYYAPVGWYWWTGAPSFLSSVPSGSTTTTTSSAFPPSRSSPAPSSAAPSSPPSS